MRPKLRIYLFNLLLYWVGATFTLVAQEYKVKQYGYEEGLTQPFINTINQDNNGFLWVGTGEGVFRFDGFDFEQFTSQDSLGGNFVTELFLNKKGDIWMGHREGTATRKHPDGFQTYEDLLENSGAITGITESDSVTVWLSTQTQGLLRIRSYEDITRFETAIDPEIINALLYTGSNSFLVGTNEGLYTMILTEDHSTIEDIIPVAGIPRTRISNVVGSDDLPFWVAITTEMGVYRIDKSPEDEFKASYIDPGTNQLPDNLENGIIDSKGNLWINTVGDGIIKFLFNEESEQFYGLLMINTDNGLPSDDVKCIFQDYEGNIWLGFYGSGLARLIGDEIQFYSYSKLLNEDEIYALAETDDVIWAGFNGQLIKINKSDPSTINKTGIKRGLPNDKITSIYIQNEDWLWIGTEKSGLFRINLVSELINKIPISDNSLENSINCMEGYDNQLFIGTKRGMCQYNITTRDKIWYNTSNGLSHNNILDLYVDSKKRVLIGAMGNTLPAIAEDGTMEYLTISNFSGLLTLQSITEDKIGNIWVSTYGNGVFKIEENLASNYNRNSGILSDYCYGIVFDGVNSILVSHRGGISIINVSNNTVKILAANMGISSSLEFNLNTIQRSLDNHIWFGTNQGLILYYSGESEIGKKPPKLNIVAARANNELLDITKPVYLKPGTYNIEIEYIGISLRSPEFVKYHYFLEGYDQGWSDLTQERIVLYPQIGRGEYTFQIRAFNENMISDREPVTFSIKVKTPFFSTFWFYLILVVLMVGAVYLIIRLRVRSLEQAKERLLQNLDEKTREVIAKEELIKERKKVEKELREAKDHAEQSDRLKSAFLANMSHEIRTPMNAIVGFSQLLQEPQLADEDLEEYIKSINSNSESLLALIDDIIDISKLESGQLNVVIKPCPINEILSGLYEKYKMKLAGMEKEHIDMVLKLGNGEKGFQIQSDYLRLRQVLNKLLDNAVKFTESGKIEFGYELRSDTIRFFVNDTGIGLSEDHEKYIFELFRKVEDDQLKLYRGTGLGLALSQRLIQLLKGKIDVVSEVGKGSQFFFSLPLVSALAKPDVVDPDKKLDLDKIDWADRKLLVVEDEESNFQLVKELLRKTKIQVSWAMDGEEGLRLFNEEKDWDIILMDIKLPGLDGYEVTKQIRATGSKVPIIAQTAYAMVGDREKSIEAGCNNYITKPIRRELLIEMMEVFLAQKG